MQLIKFNYSSLPSPQVKKQYSRYAKLFHKFVCPELTLMQAQYKFIQEVGFFNWNDYLNGGFTDFQRTKMLAEWVHDFCEKRGYLCVSPLPSLPNSMM